MRKRSVADQWVLSLVSTLVMYICACIRTYVRTCSIPVHASWKWLSTCYLCYYCQTSFGHLQSGAEEVAQIGAVAKPNLGPLPETPGAISERPLPPPPGEELYESLADLKAKGATGNRDKTLPRMSDNALSFSENDFSFVRVLGRGSFGKVREKRRIWSTAWEPQLSYAWCGIGSCYGIKPNGDVVEQYLVLWLMKTLEVEASLCNLLPCHGRAQQHLHSILCLFKLVSKFVWI